MIKATFSEPQKELTTFYPKEGMTQYQICCHEEIIEDETEEGKEVSYQYDYNEFTERKDILSEADVMSKLENYLDYKPAKAIEVPTNKQSEVEAELASLKERQELADQVLQELILAQLGGE